MAECPTEFEGGSGFDGSRYLEVSLEELVARKMFDAGVPGFMAEFTAEEADLAGAFLEDALGEHEAYESSPDLATDSAHH